MSNNEDEKVNVLYEDIVNEMDYDALPIDWKLNNIEYFSDEKTLFDYQKKAIQNITKFLKYFYNDLYNYPKNNTYDEFVKAKKNLYDKLLIRHNEIKDLGLDDNNKAVKEILNNYNSYEYKDYKEQNRKVISFYNFVNRAGFWMATASGKTIVIIKLIELLDYLMKNGKTPKNDILFLTYTEDQKNQFLKQLEEYNNYHTRKINTYDLKDYDKIKNDPQFASNDNINIFISRSDLISNETKKNLLSYKDFENGGKWYIILDEAHKGDKEDSKRQVYYSFMTRFGFLFNFSATFTDPWDITTTVLNFNLDNFIKKGYGKNLYVFQKNIENFKKIGEHDKEKIVLKSLILLTAIKKSRENIINSLNKEQLNIKKDLYHNPMMIIYANSVNANGSDLKPVFDVIGKIAIGANKEDYEEARKELLDDLKKDNKYVFDHGEKLEFDEELLKNISYDQILKCVYNAETNGVIEAIKIPKNKEELALKLKTSDKPFALIRIGDIGKWIKEKMANYEINETYQENKSYFNELNKDTDSINILLGSRTFYEGWDSNRPNVIMFINIGTGESKKFVLQAIGRGERIEPLENMRQRLNFLDGEKVKVVKEKVKPCDVSMIESLFVFGTDAEHIITIMNLIRNEINKSGSPIENVNKNKNIDGNDLLIPVYKKLYKPEISEIPKFSGNYKLLLDYINWLNDNKIDNKTDNKILYAIYNDDLHVSDIERLISYLSDENNFHKNSEGNIFRQTEYLIRHINITLENFHTFKNLGDEIVHFKNIKAILDENELKDLRNKIQKIADFDVKKEQLDILTRKLQNKEISQEEFQRQYDNLKQSEIEEFQTGPYKLTIRSIRNHYYNPVLIAEDPNEEDLINHIIKEPSEKEFIENLENYIKDNKVNVDYWFFSKIDQTTDKIYIPYYDKENNSQSNFYPDFIFWIKKGKDYYIIFVDPKSRKFTEYEYKVDGYSRIFEENGNPKRFEYDKYNIYVYLLLYTDDRKKLPKRYERYWYDKPENIFSKVK